MKFITAIATLIIAGTTYADIQVAKSTKDEQLKPVNQGGVFADATLTKDQRLKIAAIMKADREEMKKQIEELHANHATKKNPKRQRL